jgi:hypothetical protein
MRYLKKYDKLFESEVVNNCEDILLELDDQGFITNVIHTPRYLGGNPETIVLKIRRNLIHGEYDDENLFKYSEIEEYVERTIDYLEAETDFMMVKASIVWLRFPTYPRNRNLDTLNISDSRVRGGCADKLRDFGKLAWSDIPRKDRKIMQTIYLHFTR